LYTLVVCEKPDAARRIAQALGDPKESRPAGISVFDVTSDGRRYMICSAIGHLYGIADVTKNRSVYPVLDLEWAPVANNPRAARAIKVISELSKDASAFVHACDYDQEGEVIGHCILQYACGNKYEKAQRAKFSTLTDEEIRESFASVTKPNSGLAEAGRSRHMLDFIYGVNLSRALAKSLKTASRYRNLSIGRVQGPTLAFAVDRELEIRLHVPDPYWTISAQFEKNGQAFSSQYEKPKVEALAEAQSIVSACVGKDGTVTDISDSKAVLRPPARSVQAVQARPRLHACDSRKAVPASIDFISAHVEPKAAAVNRVLQDNFRHFKNRKLRQADFDATLKGAPCAK